MGKRQGRAGQQLFFFACVMVALILICGCGHFHEGYLAKASFKEANNFFSQGNYDSSLSRYAQILEKYPTAGDRVLFEMGIVHAYPNNERKDYQKAIECFQKIVRDYPESAYRQDSEMMIFHINNVIIKDGRLKTQQLRIENLQGELEDRRKEIRAQQKELDALAQKVKGKDDDLMVMQKKMEALEQKNFAFQNGPADRILIEKQARRLTLFANNRELKTYKIALGGDPVGPKERQGDNKTPEGAYIIDSRNMNSRYHLSLRISYPNEKDKKRAKELGVTPGGDIMIHGIKNGFSWIGDTHSEFDWTRGCIAVTDEEIEEIGKLAPNGTGVEIRP